MLKNTLNILKLLILAVILSNCSKDPNPVGEGLLSQNDNLVSSSTILFSNSAKSYSVKASNNSTTIMVGKFSEDNNYIEAKTLIQFTSTAVDTVFLNSIINCELKLQPIYSFPDTAGVLSFAVHKILKSWTDYTFTIDSLVSGFFDPNQVHEYSINVNAKDTLPVKIPIGNSLVKDWLKGSDNYGVILIPKTTSNFVLGFSSSDLFTSDAPELIINYQLPEDTSAKTLILKVRQDATVITGDMSNFPNNLHIVHGGLLNRAIYNFSVDTIPRASTILEAKLILYVDTNYSRFSPFSLKKILVQEVATADSIPKLGALSVDNTIFGDSIILNIQQIVQKWVTRKPNYGIALRAFNEFTEVDRIAIFNRYSSKPPRLEIKYLRLP